MPVHPLRVHYLQLCQIECLPLCSLDLLRQYDQGPSRAYRDSPPLASVRVSSTGFRKLVPAGENQAVPKHYNPDFTSYKKRRVTF